VTFPQDDAPKAQKPDDEYRKYLDESGQVKPAFEGSGEGGLLSNSEYKKMGTQQGGGSLSEFKRFRSWYGEHGAQWQTHLQTAQTETMVPTYSFARLSKLAEICPQITFNSAEVKE
jgi:CRISPR-associated protein Cmr2